MRKRLGGSPAYALAIVALLVAVQGEAFVRQWRLGFRPGGQAPVRVPFSWDMFAVEIERCDLSWEPPDPRPDRPRSRMHDLAAPIEWDPVYNHRADYVEAGSVACNDRARGAPGSAAGMVVRIHCFTGKGEQTNEEYACPPP